MANEINVPSAASQTIYVIIWNATGSVYDDTNSNFETYLTAQRGNYDIPVTEQGTASGYYLADFPTAITSAGVYSYVGYIQAGGSPAETDQLVSSGTIDWTGSSAVATPTGGIQTRTRSFTNRRQMPFKS